MRIAVFLDYYIYTENMSREGVIVFLRNAIKAWLEYDKNITFELWCYPSDKSKVEKDFNDLFSPYENRVDYLPGKIMRKDLKFGKFFPFALKAFVQKMISITLPFTEYGKIMKTKAKANWIKYMNSRLCFKNAFERESRADLAYVPFIELEGALGIKVPVVMQIHDLYIFLIRDLFEKDLVDKMNIDKWEKDTIFRLKKYVDQGAYFQTSSNFTKETQILKYIDGLDEEKCKVISFPPMIRNIAEKDILSEKEFRNKYHIGNYKYLAFPSQNRPGKNVITLLKAIAIVNENGWDVRLVTTGSMNDLNSTSEFVNEHKNIVIQIGHIPDEDIPALYKYSSLVACPNMIEGQLISDQAVSALKIGGIPVIHGKSYGIEEAINNIGMTMESADLNWFELQDANELAGKIIEVLSNPSDTIRKQEKISKAFREKTWTEFAKNSLSFYQEIIAWEKVN